jgi:hypothetical protein
VRRSRKPIERRGEQEEQEEQKEQEEQQVEEEEEAERKGRRGRRKIHERETEFEVSRRSRTKLSTTVIVSSIGEAKNRSSFCFSVSFSSFSTLLLSSFWREEEEEVEVRAECDLERERKEEEEEREEEEEEEKWGGVWCDPNRGLRGEVDGEAFEEEETKDPLRLGEEGRRREGEVEEGGGILLSMIKMWFHERSEEEATFLHDLHTPPAAQREEGKEEEPSSSERNSKMRRRTSSGRRSKVEEEEEEDGEEGKEVEVSSPLVLGMVSVISWLSILRRGKEEVKYFRLPIKQFRSKECRAWGICREILFKLFLLLVCC